MIFLLIHLIFILKISNYFLYINFFNSSYNNFTKTILYEYYSNLNINIFFLKEISYSLFKITTIQNFKISTNESKIIIHIPFFYIYYIIYVVNS